MLRLSLSIVDRVEVFNARSSLNYSWKRQIRRPFSVRAYGNDNKSDPVAVFFFYGKCAFARSSQSFPFFFSHSLPSSLLFSLLSLISFLILGSSYLKRNVLFIFYFSLRSASHLEIFFTLSFLQICGSALLTLLFY